MQVSDLDGLWEYGFRSDETEDAGRCVISTSAFVWHQGYLLLVRSAGVSADFLTASEVPRIMIKPFDPDATS